MTKTRKSVLGFYEAAYVANQIANRFVENDEFHLIYNGYIANYKVYDNFEDYMENYLTSYAHDEFWKNRQ